MTSNAQITEVEAVKSVLNSYKKSLESLDTTGIPKLFIKNARVFEQAKDEGSIQNYLTHHLDNVLGNKILYLIKNRLSCN